MATNNSWTVNHDNFKHHMESLLIAHEAHIDYLRSMTNSKAMKKAMKNFVENDLKLKAVDVFSNNF